MSKETNIDPIRVQMLYTDGYVPGYPELIPIRGLPIFNHFLKLENVDPREVWVRPHHRSDLPQYQTVEKRMSADEANAAVQGIYPEMDMPYFRLGIASKGVANGGSGMAPFVLLHGPTGTGKTNTLRGVASACGEKEFGLISQKPDNYAEGLGNGACASSFILWDEVFKFEQPIWESNIRPLILSIGRNFTYRPLYHGTRTVPFNSAVYFCDTELPDYVRNDEQFARRVIYVRLAVPGWSRHVHHVAMLDRSGELMLAPDDETLWRKLREKMSCPTLEQWGEAVMKEVHRSAMLLECEAFGVPEGLRAFVLAENAQEVFDGIIAEHVGRIGIPRRAVA